MNRRQFLCGVAAAAVAPALKPVPPIPLDTWGESVRFVDSVHLHPFNEHYGTSIAAMLWEHQRKLTEAWRSVLERAIDQPTNYYTVGKPQPVSLAKQRVITNKLKAASYNGYAYHSVWIDEEAEMDEAFRASFEWGRVHGVRYIETDPAGIKIKAIDPQEFYIDAFTTGQENNGPGRDET